MYRSRAGVEKFVQPPEYAEQKSTDILQPELKFTAYVFLRV